MVVYGSSFFAGFPLPNSTGDKFVLSRPGFQSQIYCGLLKTCKLETGSDKTRLDSFVLTVSVV